MGNSLKGFGLICSPLIAEVLYFGEKSNGGEQPVATLRKSSNTHNVTNATKQSSKLQVMAADVPRVLLRQQSSVGHPANAQIHLLVLLWKRLTMYGQK